MGTTEILLIAWGMWLAGCFIGIGIGRAIEIKQNKKENTNVEFTSKRNVG